jgi:hypothetical protein
VKTDNPEAAADDHIHGRETNNVVGGRVLVRDQVFTTSLVSGPSRKGSGH